MMRYVLGLPFSASGACVMLARKQRPEWQTGKLNGIGGKVEPGEEWADAMAREAHEETTMVGNPWDHVATLAGSDFIMRIYACFDDINLRLRARTDEMLYPFWTHDVMRAQDLIPNLRVFIPLALDRTGIIKPVLFYDGTQPA